MNLLHLFALMSNIHWYLVLTMYTILHSDVGAAWRSGCLIRNVQVVGSSPITGPRCILEQETLPLLLSTGWSQERIRA